jgi:hypothetical protein
MHEDVVDVATGFGDLCFCALSSQPLRRNGRIPPRSPPIGSLTFNLAKYWGDDGEDYVIPLR